MDEIAVPTDVRLMNVASSVLLACLLAAIVGAALYWVTQRPYFALRGISITGDTQNNSVATIRANVLPHLTGNFFTLDLNRARQIFEQVPWVRRAVVTRDFPNRIQVRLQEHTPVAMFGQDSESILVNDRGEVFVANAAGVADDLPRFVGHELQAPQILQMHRSLNPVFAQLELEVVQITLTNQGSWQVLLDNEATVELGRGEAHLIVMSARKLVQAITSATHQLGRTPADLEYADLRYPTGFAMRLRGVKTQVPHNFTTKP